MIWPIIVSCFFSVAIGSPAETIFAAGDPVDHQNEMDIFKGLDLEFLESYSGYPRRKIITEEFDHSRSPKRQKIAVGLDGLYNNRPSDSLGSFDQSIGDPLSDQALNWSDVGCYVEKQNTRHDDTTQEVEPLLIERALGQPDRSQADQQLQPTERNPASGDPKKHSESAGFDANQITEAAGALTRYSFVSEPTIRLHSLERRAKEAIGKQSIRDRHAARQFNERVLLQIRELEVIYTPSPDIRESSQVLLQPSRPIQEALPIIMLARFVPPSSHTCWVKLPLDVKKRGKERILNDVVYARISHLADHLNRFHNLFRFNGLDRIVLGKATNTHKALLDWFYDLVFTATLDRLPLLGQIHPTCSLRTLTDPQIILYKILTDSKKLNRHTAAVAALDLMEHWYQQHPSRLPNCPLSKQGGYLKLIYDRVFKPKKTLHSKRRGR
ncbi:hypothetical protein PGTUg99_007433 [Puccinia graminis f. sp. tritici]|uniref:Uncharacterized protein n=1 Tax=Puccinia graminis f. sp. tritici TaxID=56615 RepID=A0A5B0LNE7_PUCGR|nr:hypothetical protein PGTUg99_007433 [Puccinia graminis f. sp. tritici]